MNYSLPQDVRDILLWAVAPNTITKESKERRDRAHMRVDASHILGCCGGVEETRWLCIVPFERRHQLRGLQLPSVGI